MRPIDAISDDVEQLIDEMGEPVEYRPANGTPRTIYGIVTRERVDGGTGNAPKARPSIVVRLINSPTKGVVLASLDFNADAIGVAYLRGSALQSFGFTREILSQCPGSFRIRLR